MATSKSKKPSRPMKSGVEKGFPKEMRENVPKVEVMGNSAANPPNNSPSIKDISYSSHSTSSSQGPNWTLMVLVIGALLLAGAWYFARPMDTPGPVVLNTTSNATDLLTSASAVALLSSFDKLQRLPNSYELSLAEPIDGVDANISLRQNGQDRMATVTTVLNTRTYYWVGNATVACEQVGKQAEQCADVSGEQGLLNYGVRLNATFPTTTNGPSQKEDHAKMITMGALEFGAPPQHQTVAGRGCTDLKYTFDFTRLTPTQLGEIHMNVNSPLVSVFRNFQVEKCVDDQLGIALISHLKYDYVDPRTNQKVPLEDQSTYQMFVTPMTGALTLPAVNANGTALTTKVVWVNDVLTAVGRCSSAPNQSVQDQCVRSTAVSYGQIELCQLVRDASVRGQCVTIIATDLKASEDCKQAGTYENECYANIAVATRQDSYCTLIADMAERQTCLDIVNQTIRDWAKQVNGTGTAWAPTGSNNTSMNYSRAGE